VVGGGAAQELRPAADVDDRAWLDLVVPQPRDHLAGGAPVGQRDQIDRHPGGGGQVPAGGAVAPPASEPGRVGGGVGQSQSQRGVVGAHAAVVLAAGAADKALAQRWHRMVDGHDGDGELGELERRHKRRG